MKIEFEQDVITANILRHWDRDKIERFALHLLGSEYPTKLCDCGYDTCEECNTLATENLDH